MAATPPLLDDRLGDEAEPKRGVSNKDKRKLNEQAKNQGGVPQSNINSGNNVPSRPNGTGPSPQSSSGVTNASGGSNKLDEKSLRTIAKLVDARLLTEFAMREEALKELQGTMSRMRMQLQVQSNNWKQFVTKSGKGQVGAHPPKKPSPRKRNANNDGEDPDNDGPPTPIAALRKQKVRLKAYRE